MGTEVDVFLGPLDALKGWKDQLKSVVVFSLTPELGLVPVTEELKQELELLPRRQPTAGEGRSRFSWACEASKGCTIAYYSCHEFGDSGNEYEWAWTDQNRVEDVFGMSRVLKLLGTKAGQTFESIGLDRYRTTSQWAAAAVLQDIENRGGIAGIFENLKHLSGEVRFRAAADLILYGQSAEVALPTLVEMAKSDPSYGVRLRAVLAMGAMGPVGVAALITLLKPGALHNPLSNEWHDGLVRKEVISSLGRIGPSAAPATSDLDRILRADPDGLMRTEAAAALGKIGPLAQAAIPTLIEVRNHDQSALCNSAWALGQMGPAARQAIPALLKALWDKDKQVPEIVMEVLERLGSAAVATPELITMLKTAKSPRRRCTAAQCLGKIRSDAQEAIPALIEALGDEAYSVRSSAVAAIGAMGPVARQAIPALHEALNDDHKEVQRSAAKALTQVQGGG